MTGRIQHEIRQSKPMSLAVEAHLNLQRTATAIRQRVEETTSAVAGLKHTDYNVLRILRGAGEAGLSSEQIRERLMAPDPMLPGVLGSLANRGLLERHEQHRRITAAGLDALSTLDERVERTLADRMSRLPAADLRKLIDALEQLRD